MGAENDHLDPGTEIGPVVDTPLGRLGMYACMEGVINEVTRGMALRGAQVLLNSLNSFALDEADLHIPVRAAENQVWVVAANKVGPLLPERASAGDGRQPRRAAGVAARRGREPDRRARRHRRRQGAAHRRGRRRRRHRPRRRRRQAPPRRHRRVRRPPPRALRPDRRRAARPPARPPAPPTCRSPWSAPRSPGRPRSSSPRPPPTARSSLVLPSSATPPPSPAAWPAPTRTPSPPSTTARTGVLVNAAGEQGRQPQLHTAGGADAAGDLRTALGRAGDRRRRRRDLPGDVPARRPRRRRRGRGAVHAREELGAEPRPARAGRREPAQRDRRQPAGSPAAIYAMSPDFTLWTKWEGPFTGRISSPVTTDGAGRHCRRARARRAGPGHEPQRLPPYRSRRRPPVAAARRPDRTSRGARG